MSLSFRRGERSFHGTMPPLALPPLALPPTMKKARAETRLDGKGVHLALLMPRHGRVSSTVTVVTACHKALDFQTGLIMEMLHSALIKPFPPSLQNTARPSPGQRTCCPSAFTSVFTCRRCPMLAPSDSRFSSFLHFPSLPCSSPKDYNYTPTCQSAPLPPSLECKLPKGTAQSSSMASQVQWTKYIVTRAATVQSPMYPLGAVEP